MKSHDKVFLVLCVLVSAMLLTATALLAADEDKDKAEVGSSGGATVIVGPEMSPGPPTGERIWIDIQHLGKMDVVHPSGLSVGVKKMAIGTDQIVLSLNAHNRSERTLELNGHDMKIRDDLGGEFRLMTPVDDPKLPLAPGQAMHTELTFLGPVNPVAKSLTLLINDGEEGDAETTAQPRIAISEIPAQPTASTDTAGR